MRMMNNWQECWSKVDAVIGWLSEAEARKLHDMAREASLHVVELGAFMGRSTVALAAGLGSRRVLPGAGQSFVISVDTWRGTADSSDTGLHQAMMGDVGVTDLYALHKKNLTTAGLDGHVRRIRGSSNGEAHEWAKEWQIKAGLLFIDARHDYESVKTDFTLWSPLVIRGGTVAFHDSWAPGPAQVIAEAEAECPNLRRVDGAGSLAIFKVVR